MIKGYILTRASGDLWGQTFVSREMARKELESYGEDGKDLVIRPLHLSTLTGQLIKPDGTILKHPSLPGNRRKVTSLEERDGHIEGAAKISKRLRVVRWNPEIERWEIRGDVDVVADVEG